MIDNIPAWVGVLTVAVTAGAAFGGVKVGLNGMRVRTKTTDDNVREIRALLTDHLIDETKHQARIAEQHLVTASRLGSIEGSLSEMRHHAKLLNESHHRMESL